MGTILNLTPEQELLLEACLDGKSEKYNEFTNNCADPLQDCLTEVLKHDFTKSLFPVSFGRELLNSPFFKDLKYYPGPTRNFFDDAPWAR